jgi:cysteinyl-tRNA synthetase
MDLQFPHHESEIAQSTICNHQAPVRYWMHNNMITLNGKKMGKSYNNVIKLTELFSGEHPLLSQPFHPMTIRFFILQSHYRSTLDFGNDALVASEKAFKRLWEAYEVLQKLPESTLVSANDIELDAKINTWLNELGHFMDDDFSTAKVLANLFEMAPVINSFKDGLIALDAIEGNTLRKMKSHFKLYIEDILGLQQVSNADNEVFDAVIQLLIDIRKEAKSKKDFATSDKIRNQLAGLGIQLKDEKNGEMSWSVT